MDHHFNTHVTDFVLALSHSTLLYELVSPIGKLHRHPSERRRGTLDMRQPLMNAANWLAGTGFQARQRAALHTPRHVL